MLSIFQFFATKTDASALRMLKGSPAERLLKPITNYIEGKGGRIHTQWGCREVLYDEGPDGRPARVTGLRLGRSVEEKVVTADAYVAALDVPGAKKLIPEVRVWWGGEGGWGEGARLGGWVAVEWRVAGRGPRCLRPSPAQAPPKVPCCPRHRGSVHVSLPCPDAMLPPCCAPVHTQAWRSDPFFDNIFQLVGVPVITVQLRYDGWVTEMADAQRARQLGGGAAGLDNLLYSADADFSCFADLALTSPVDYYRADLGSLMQCVLTPADPYLPKTNEEIVAEVDRQVRVLFPSAAGLQLLWHSVVKIGQSLYREAPGMDIYRPDQRTPIPNFFLAGSYTKQDYIDSMEGASLSGRQAAYKILADAVILAGN